MATDMSSPASVSHSPVSPSYSPAKPEGDHQGDSSPIYQPLSPTYSPRSPAYTPTGSMPERSMGQKTPSYSYTPGGAATASSPAYAPKRSKSDYSGKTFGKDMFGQRTSPAWSPTYSPSGTPAAGLSPSVALTSPMYTPLSPAYTPTSPVYTPTSPAYSVPQSRHAGRGGALSPVPEHDLQAGDPVIQESAAPSEGAPTSPTYTPHQQPGSANPLMGLGARSSGASVTDVEAKSAIFDDDEETKAPTIPVTGGARSSAGRGAVARASPGFPQYSPTSPAPDDAADLD